MWVSPLWLSALQLSISFNTCVWQGGKNRFGIGGLKNFCADFFYIAFTYQRDTILYISTSVISNIQLDVNIF